MRDFWAGPVEKMKTLHFSPFLQSCMNDREGTSEFCATLSITGLEGGNRKRGLKHPGYKASHLCITALCSDAKLCGGPRSERLKPAHGKPHSLLWKAQGCDLWRHPTWCTECNALRPSLLLKGVRDSPRTLAETCYRNGDPSLALCFLG